MALDEPKINSDAMRVMCIAADSNSDVKLTANAASSMCWACFMTKSLLGTHR